MSAVADRMHSVPGERIEGFGEAPLGSPPIEHIQYREVQMKSIILTLLLSIVSTAATATEFALIQPEVYDANYNSSTDSIELAIGHGGGCGEHNYEFRMGPACAKSYPVKCTAEIYDRTNDHCEAYVYKTVSFSVNELGLDDPYFNGASINVFGGSDTSATVSLPFYQD